MPDAGPLYRLDIALKVMGYDQVPMTSYYLGTPPDGVDRALLLGVIGGTLHGTSQAHVGVTWPLPQVPAPEIMAIDGRDDTLKVEHEDPYLMEFLWIMEPPFYQIGWTIEPEDAVDGSRDVVYTFEWKAAVWDLLGASPEESVRHEFSPGM